MQSSSVIAAGEYDGLQQFLVAVWRFNEYLGLIAGYRFLFQLNQLFHTPVSFHWQVAVKYER